MYAASGTTTVPRRPLPHRLLTGSWSDRHPSLSITIRMVSGIWNLSLGTFLLSYGYLIGLLPLTASALLFTAVYLVAKAQAQSRPNGHS